MDPPFRFSGPQALDLDAEIVADRHERVKRAPAGGALTVQQDA
jgi:hypothetical protein